MTPIYFSSKTIFYTHRVRSISWKHLLTANSILPIVFFLLSPPAFSQTPIKKEVEVVKPYEPTVSDANKINVLPQIKDSVTIRPAFNYSIVPMMVNTEYNVPAINAARMLAMPITKH